MRHTAEALALLALVALAAAPAAADERADWGVIVSVGAPAGEHTLLVENPAGWHLVAVDPAARIRGLGLDTMMTFSDIRPGDRIDYQVAPWAGADIADVLHVTPRRQARAVQ